MREENDKLTGVIFRLNDSKPGDKVVHILASDGSRRVVIANGVKKSTSRKAHAVDLMNLVQVKTTGRSNMPLVTDIKLLDKYERFKKTYKGLLFAQLVCEILHLFVQEEQEEIGYYRNVINMLSAKAEKLDLLAASLIIRFLLLSGNLPKLNEDIHDGSDILPTDDRFPNLEIGYTRDSNLATAPAISDRIFKAQRFILKNDFVTIQRLDLDEEEQKQMLALHIDWMQKVTEREIKSYLLFKDA